MKKGAIIVCGGRSMRMGRDKATLPFGPELMLQRVARLLLTIIEPDKIVVVAATGQNLPVLPAEVLITRDRVADRGPLQGLLAGFEAVHDRVDAVFATSCDAPLLVPTFVERLFDQLEECDAVVPCDDEFSHPLAAVYRLRLISTIRELLDNQQLRLSSLLDSVRTRRIPTIELRDVDPELRTLMNLNSSEDYEAALRLAVFPNSNPA